MSKVAAILLAAGESRRWGEDNKLLAPIDGKPMIRRAAEAVLGSKLRPVIVITGHDSAAVEAALTGLDVQFKRAPDFADGMSASVKAGIAAVAAACDAALICLGDMPFIRPETFDRLVEGFDPAAGKVAMFPTFQGKRGNPVLLARALFFNIMRLSGDEGARALLRAIPERVGEVPVDDPGVLRDVDRPDALNR